jgi:hypothetical protein
MRWTVQGHHAECSGCSGNCGMAWPSDQPTPEQFQQDQLELLAWQNLNERVM